MSHDWSYEAEIILKEKFPLHFCCREGNSDDLQKLIMTLDHDKLFEEDSFYYWTPAHWAAYFGKLNCLRILMQIPGYSSSMCTTNFRQTPLHVAAFGGQTHCLNWLFQGENDLLKIVNQQDYMGETPLHKAARTGSMECVQLLLSQGADATVQSFSLRSPADIAALSGYVHCATVIRQVAQFSNNATHTVEIPIKTPEIHAPNGDALMEMMDTGLVAHNIHDVTIDPDISSNRKLLGGRKRSRAGLCEDSCKRQRIEEPNNNSHGPLFSNGELAAQFDIDCSGMARSVSNGLSHMI